MIPADRATSKNPYGGKRKRILRTARANTELTMVNSPSSRPLRDRRFQVFALLAFESARREERYEGREEKEGSGRAGVKCLAAKSSVVSESSRPDRETGTSAESNIGVILSDMIIVAFSGWLWWMI